MADLSKIRLNGSEYYFKDAAARAALANKLDSTALNNYYTSSETNTAIASAIGDIVGVEFSVVASLPTTGDAGTIYLISNSGSGNNIYDEYIYVSNRFEKIGTTEVDLTHYLQDTDIAAWAKAANKPSYTAAEVGALPSTTVIPSATSDLTNDSGFITLAQVPAAPVTSVNGNTGAVTGLQTTANLVTSMSASSTDTQYPSAKAVYDAINVAIGSIVNGNTIPY